MERAFVDEPRAIARSIGLDVGPKPRKGKRERAPSTAARVDHLKAFTKLLQEFHRANGLHSVFDDFCELAALAVSNAVDKTQYEPREKRYLETIKRYSREDAFRFPKLLVHLVLGLDDHPRDFLGEAWTQLELKGSSAQVWTPYTVSSMMARMILQNPQEIIDKHGYISALEPACGPGGMCVAAAHALLDQGINFQKHLHFTAVDVDRTAVHMTYLQTSLYGIPAIVHQGNSLTLEKRETWFTPMHVMGGWGMRLAIKEAMALFEGRDEIPPFRLEMSPEAVPAARAAE